MSGDPYVYPGTTVLKNKLDIRDPDQLDRAERRFARQRARQGIPRGDFDLKHLQSIHKHLFQDVYDWAGKVRTVEISKGGSHFQPTQYVENGMADVHRRITQAGYFQGSSRQAFAAEAGKILGDVNYVHPFREGNGRVQLLYLKQLAEKAGHRLDLKRIEQSSWMDASREAHSGDYSAMTKCIERALGQERDLMRGRTGDREQGRER